MIRSGIGAGIVLKILSGVAYVFVFRSVFCRAMRLSTSAEIGFSELGANAVLPTGGLGGLALGNAYRAALMLNLIGADWQPVFVDFFGKGVQRSPEWRNSVNEMGEAPVLVRHGTKKLVKSW